MTRYIRILFIFLCCSALSCQNEGYIGTLFGSWSLDEMTVDDVVVPLPARAEAALLSMHGRFALFALDFGMQQDIHYFATWTRDGDSLTFDFAHSDYGDEPGTGSYTPPDWLGFDRLIENVTITRLDHSHFDFIREGSDGRTYYYKFKHTW